MARSPAETPYQLDPAQTLKASQALLKHMVEERKTREAQAAKKNLLAADEDQAALEADPIQLIITTKKQIVKDKSLKPRKIPIPHTLNTDLSVSSVCLITADPQRSFKDVIADAAFPKEFAEKIRVIGISKVKARYKSFEQKRQFRDEHDIFLADDRIITMLPSVLGKIFFESGAKRPLPVSLSLRPKDNEGKTVKADKKINSNKRNRGDDKEIPILKPEAFAREIEKTLSSAQVHLTPSVTTSVRVGFSTFSAKNLAENIDAVVTGMTEKFVGKGWRGIRSILVKGPKTISLTIWQTPELWEQEEDVIEDEDAEKMRDMLDSTGRSSKKRRAADERETTNSEAGNGGGGRSGKKQKSLLSGSSGTGADKQSKTSAADTAASLQRRQKLRDQKQAAKSAIVAGA